jgi:hypothetical protein
MSDRDGRMPGIGSWPLESGRSGLGDPVMRDEDLAVFTSSFEASRFTGSINWYRNMDRN